MLLLLLFSLGTRLCRLLLCFRLVVGLLLLLVFYVVHAHACQLVLDRHDRVAQEHSTLCGLHDCKEVLCCLRTEARAVAAVADRLCDAIGTAVNLCEDGGEKCRAGRTEFAVFRLVVLCTVDAEGLADVLLLLRDVVLQLGRLAFRQEA